MCSCIIQELCKGIHHQLFACPKHGYNCRFFAIAFPAEILDGKSPMEARFHVERIRGHWNNCLNRKQNTSCSTPEVKTL